MFRAQTDDAVLRCPFCNAPIAEPREIMTRFGNVIDAGECQCGGVYVYDGSGHNLGDAYVDALTLAYDGNLDEAWKQVPDEDYEVKELSYNKRRHAFGRESSVRGRRSPMYVFVRVKGK